MGAASSSAVEDRRRRATHDGTQNFVTGDGRRVSKPEQQRQGATLHPLDIQGRDCNSFQGDKFSFAICSGIQYADKDCCSGWSDKHRVGLDRLMHACRHWVMPEESLSFVLSLGDMTVPNASSEATESDIQRALKLFDRLVRNSNFAAVPIFFLGNVKPSKRL